MPKIDIAAVPERKGSGYPPPFDAPCAARTRQRLGDAGGLRDFGVNLMSLPPGNWSSQRHWHSTKTNSSIVLEGELTLIEDGGETVLRAGDCAAFPKGTGNGHHLINRSAAMAVYLEVGSRNPHDLTTCSDIDMMSANADGRFVHKDGTPYPRQSGAQHAQDGGSGVGVAITKLTLLETPMTKTLPASIERHAVTLAIATVVRRRRGRVLPRLRR